MAASKIVQSRIANLKQHLLAEHPSLVRFVSSYEQLDGVLRGMRLLGKDETLTSRIGFWPVVSVVGLFSAGKSTFINDFLGQPVQRTGNQAVDDKFTVLCHGAQMRDLPGTALDVDARFPFHGMGDEIEQVAPGEGKMVDRYLALKTVPSEQVKGLIMVDSPGFDSDEYRAATLRLVDHVLDLSDLTLVLFDARKPEPGVMRDTLSKLVARIKTRSDANKFLFVLNQIDTTARENNLEEVVGAWQRALASVGITGGRFYSIFSDSASGEVQPRLRELRDRDMNEIRLRIAELPSVRGYRVANGAEAAVKELREQVVPQLEAAIAKHRAQRTTWTGIACGLLLAGAAGFGIAAGDPAATLGLVASAPEIAVPALGLGFLGLRAKIGSLTAKRIAKGLPERTEGFGYTVRAAFLASTGFWHSWFRSPTGWSGRTNRKLDEIHEAIAAEVRTMNDRFANPGMIDGPKEAA